MYFLSNIWLRAARSIVPDGIPPPRTVSFDAPWVWLAAGWRDLWSVGVPSLAYGAVFALAAAIMVLGLSQYEAHSVFLALAAGFLLIGPFLAVGLYEASRRLTLGQRVTLRDMMFSGFGARGQLPFFGAVLMFVFLVWMQIAFLILMLFLGSGDVPPASQFTQFLLFTPRGLGLLLAGSAVGGVMAAFVFAISAVAVPMLLVHRTDAVTAARASVAAVLANPKAMALWAALIVVLMATGFATFLVGLVVAFPLIGHATWHAYSEIYGQR
jgi:uncharacterized membrane protein